MALLLVSGNRTRLPSSLRAKKHCKCQDEEIRKRIVLKEEKEIFTLKKGEIKNVGVRKGKLLVVK